MNSDAADVGYGGMMGIGMAAAFTGLLEGRGLLTAKECAKSITLREIRAVCILIHKNFSTYVSYLHVNRV